MSLSKGTLITLTDTDFCRPSELKRLLGYMQETLPSILPELPDGSRHESMVRLRSFSEDPKMQHLQPELDVLIAAVEKSVETNTSR